MKALTIMFFISMEMLRILVMPLNLPEDSQQVSKSM